jgi:hypothetical protein
MQAPLSQRALAQSLTGYSATRRAERGRVQAALLCSGIPQHRNGRFSASRAESLMAMKSFIGITMPFTQSFYLLHFAIVFFCIRKELKQSSFEQLVRVGRSCKEFPPARA